MKYIKTYENYKDTSDWNVGDIVYAINSSLPTGPGGRNFKNEENVSFWSKKGRLIKDEPYEIVNIKDTSGYGQTPERYPIYVKDKNGIIVQDNYSKFKTNFSKQNFITEEEWKFNNDTKKYNL